MDGRASAELTECYTCRIRAVPVWSDPLIAFTRHLPLLGGVITPHDDVVISAQHGAVSGSRGVHAAKHCNSATHSAAS